MARILYVEDIEDNMLLVQKIVASRGHEFLWARNAEKGLEMAIASRPDLILLDLGLPDMDGQTLSILLRKEPSLQGVPILVLTAWPEEVVRQTVQAYQLNGYLCKPFSMADLLKSIEALLAAN